eukprot:INCI4776.1.p1 GENE.INCI4776.1~~INCI4776.1.p1  ORF type:complete len:446 (-),score=77.57 INCI4776.1:440-1777(-)
MCFICHVQPLHFAAGNGNLEAVQLLLDAKADMYRHGSGQSPCHLAARRGHHRVVSAFLEHGFSLHNRAGYPAASLVEVAAAAGQVNTVALLTMIHADVNARCETNALLSAAEGGHAEVVQQLLNMKDAGGATVNTNVFGAEAVRRAGRLCDDDDAGRRRKQAVLSVLLEHVDVGHDGMRGVAVSCRRGGPAATRMRNERLKDEVFAESRYLPAASGKDKARVIFETASPLSLLKELDYHGAGLPEFTPENCHRFLPSSRTARTFRAQAFVRRSQQKQRQLERKKQTSITTIEEHAHEIEDNPDMPPVEDTRKLHRLRSGGRRKKGKKHRQQQQQQQQHHHHQRGELELQRHLRKLGLSMPQHRARRREKHPESRRGRQGSDERASRQATTDTFSTETRSGIGTNKQISRAPLQLQTGRDWTRTDTELEALLKDVFEGGSQVHPCT